MNVPAQHMRRMSAFFAVRGDKMTMWPFAKLLRTLVSRDAPIIGISRLVGWYRPIVISRGVVCVILGLAILVEHRLVSDRWTDRHTLTASTVLR